MIAIGPSLVSVRRRRQVRANYRNQLWVDEKRTSYSYHISTTLGPVVVHLMTPPAREYYCLEELWQPRKVETANPVLDPPGSF